MARRPPPPPPRRRKRIAPPPPPVRRRSDPPPVITIAAQDGANAHVRRVTLNLIRHANCCPTDLRAVIDRLAAAAWDMSALDRRDTEMVYAHVDGDIADKAKAEFVADTQSIVDLYRAFPNHDHCCRLCGHQHIRWEFTLRNIAGGQDTKTGSTCIETYGLCVDGEGTAEEALKRLRAAISGAKRKATREDWQSDHPDHAERMLALRKMRVDMACLRSPWRVYKHLKHDWKGRWKSWMSGAKSVLNYYRKNEFLTEHKTTQWKAVERQGKAMLAEHAAAEAAIDTHRAYWDKFIADHPNMNDFQRRRMDACRKWNNDPNALGAFDAQLVQEIRDQHAAPTPKAEEFPEVDNDALPF